MSIHIMAQPYSLSISSSSIDDDGFNKRRNTQFER